MSTVCYFRGVWLSLCHSLYCWLLIWIHWVNDELPHRTLNAVCSAQLQIVDAQFAKQCFVNQKLQLKRWLITTRWNSCILASHDIHSCSTCKVFGEKITFRFEIDGECCGFETFLTQNGREFCVWIFARHFTIYHFVHVQSSKDAFILKPTSQSSAQWSAFWSTISRWQFNDIRQRFWFLVFGLAFSCATEFQSMAFDWIFC